MDVASVVAMIVVVVLVVGLTWLGVRLMSEPWWPALLFQQVHRAGLIGTSLFAVAVGLAVLCALALPLNAAVAALLSLFVLFGPMLACRLAAWRAWHQDKGSENDQSDLRSRAADVRNLRNERMDLPQRVKPGKPWSTYIIDAERARRQAAYRPPG